LDIKEATHEVNIFEIQDLIELSMTKIKMVKVTARHDGNDPSVQYI
jgi:hypothetical protein